MFVRTSWLLRFETAFAVAALIGMSACGGTDTTAATSTTTTDALADSPAVADPLVDTEAPVAMSEPATYTVVAGDTLSGIADRAAVGLDALVDANEWDDGIDHLIRPGDVIKLPDGATISTPASSDASTGTPAASSAEYGPPEFDFDFNDDRTAPVVIPLVDGLYYASAATATGSTVTLTLGQWFTCGDSGVAGNPTVECASGIGTLDDPSTTVTVDPDARVTVNTGDLTNFDRAGISAAEFARLVGGRTPSPSAPTGYSYESYPLFVRVKNGVAVQVEQVYTS